MIFLPPPPPPQLSLIPQLTGTLRTKETIAEECRNNYILQLEQTNAKRRQHYDTDMPQVFQVLTCGRVFICLYSCSCPSCWASVSCMGGFSSVCMLQLSVLLSKCFLYGWVFICLYSCSRRVWGSQVVVKYKGRLSSVSPNPQTSHFCH